MLTSARTERGRVRKASQANYILAVHALNGEFINMIVIWHVQMSKSVQCLFYEVSNPQILVL